jgi:hypothetical protein
MKGYTFITSSGYDPEKGKNVKDPYLGPTPTLGACMPNIRRWVVPGDHIFVISGKVQGVPQYIIGGFEVADKIDAIAAYKMFPHLRLRRDDDGQLIGNIIVTSEGKQHPLDEHTSFGTRIKNYVVGRDPLALVSPHEVAQGRAESVEILRSIFEKAGTTPHNIIGRCSKLNEGQVRELRAWLRSVKNSNPAKSR